MEALFDFVWNSIDKSLSWTVISHDILFFIEIKKLSTGTLYAWIHRPNTTQIKSIRLDPDAKPEKIAAAKKEFLSWETLHMCLYCFKHEVDIQSLCVNCYVNIKLPHKFSSECVCLEKNDRTSVILPCCRQMLHQPCLEKIAERAGAINCPYCRSVQSTRNIHCVSSRRISEID